ncbi:LOW QUALITY PROTEIN: DNA repair protein RAD50-like [Pollicipes pollicipes]|uniref:LOW QUALITY PROTEIN: DNA repair protein RAD50-like n=1 Tax=Pollicipes pollicipes TaxID=41117 RepID=UPI001884A0FC|nr:LOW QUALITY PROTEIN: DNA repair protein RAD50-like [Pollicipes pollicipes]
MSSLDGVMIQGIRSFGPKDVDRGHLKFLSPLTLILGENGCGKTTIIETLKYATTGDMPPGSNRGQSFIHDPTMAKEATVRAQVKLVFNNVRGEKMIAQRIFEGTQKARQITVKTLDGTLTRMQQGKEPVSVNKKCADFDAEMFVALGVTKPILNYVIFCHQEESNWPLDEGKKLKERFDAIFDATEYLKCIKSMKDHVKDLRNTVGVKKAEADSSRKDHEEAELLKREISTQRSRLAVSEDKVAKYKKECETLITELRRLQKIEKEAGAIEVEKTRQETLLGELKRNIESLEENLKRPGCLQVSSEVTEAELDEMMQQMVSSLAQKKRDAERDQDLLEGVERRSVQHKDTVSKLNVQLGKREAEEERFRHLRVERDSTVRELYGRHGREAPTATGELTEKDVRAAMTFMQEVLRKADADQQRVAAEVSAALERAQARVDTVRDEKTKLESELDHKRAQLEANYAEGKEIQERLAAARGSSSKLKELDATLANIDTRMDTAKNALDVDVVKARLRENEGKVVALEGEIRSLEAEKDAILANLSVKNELAIHEESLNKKEGEIRRLMNKNVDTFTTLDMADVPRDRLSQHLTAKCPSLLTLCNKNEAELKRSQKKLNSQEVTQRHLQERLASLERSLAEERSELDATLQGTDLATELAAVSAQAADLEKDHGQLVAMQRLNSGYVDRLERAQPCPLCHRDFETPGEAAELVDELRRKMDGLPREILEADEKKRRAKERYDDLLTLRPKHDHLQRLRENELPAVRAQLEEAQAELRALQQSHAALQQQAQETERHRRMADELRTDVSRIDERQRDVRQLRADRRRDEARLHQYHEELRRLGDERNDVSAERLRLEKLQADRSQLERRGNELERANETLRTESAALEGEAGDLEARYLAATASREQATVKGRAREEEQRSGFEAVRAEVDKLRGFNDALLAYARDNRAQELLTVRRQLRDLAETAREDAAEAARLRQNIDTCREHLRSQESRQRDLDDHKKLRRQRREEQCSLEAIAGLERQLAGYDTHSVREERRRLEAEHSRVTMTVCSEEGAQKQIREVVRDRSRKLSQEQFSSAERIYRQCKLELVCHSLAVKDLQTYAKALDDAIIRFHSKRMERINVIVRELWRATYQGNDIDYIEIKTDQCSGDSRRTTYNYRVVMVKQSTELEMRGRCSAGQKVLASLIIRMALAETFGVNCGMLALDEPTTNLDRANIGSLAQALEHIVRKRAVQRNFQLVIITHDEDFLAALSRTEYVDRFYKVHRNEGGLSRITKCSTSSM